MCLFCCFCIFIVQQWRRRGLHKCELIGGRSPRHKTLLTCFLLLSTTHISTHAVYTYIYIYTHHAVHYTHINTCHAYLYIYIYTPCCPLHTYQHMPCHAYLYIYTHHGVHYTHINTCHVYLYIYTHHAVHYTHINTSNPLHTYQHMQCIPIYIYTPCCPLHTHQHKHMYTYQYIYVIGSEKNWVIDTRWKKKAMPLFWNSNHHLFPFRRKLWNYASLNA